MRSRGAERAQRRASGTADAAANRLLRLEAITETALSHLDLESLLDALMERIRDLLDADTAVMLLVEDDEDVLVPRRAIGLEEELEADVRIPIGKGFAGRVAAERATVVIDDVQNYPVVNPILRERGVQSLIGAPLLHLGRVIGVVHAGSFTKEYFTHDDGLLLQLVADRVALAIAQSRLFEAEREAREDAEAAHAQVAFLARASELLSSFDSYSTATLERVAELAVPKLADEVLVDVVVDDRLERVAAAYSSPEQLAVIEEIGRRYPPTLDAEYGPGAVIRSGASQIGSDVTDEMIGQVARDAEHAQLIRTLGLKSFMTVPLVSSGRVHGAITFILSTSDRRYGPAQLEVAQELARRVSAAIENGELRAQTEERARAALVLDHIGEGVVLVDRAGVVRLWNPAAETVTGIPAAEIVGRSVVEAIPGWSLIRDRVPAVTSAKSNEVRPETLPLDLGEREIWLQISGVTFPEGTVYAFRDMTEERGLRELQTEFVATISHELRTPLAAVYGAAMTLQHRELDLTDDVKRRLLAVVFDESSRLSRIIDDVLWASRLEGGRVEFAIEHCRPAAIAASVVEAARAHVPPGISLEVRAHPSLPHMATDPDKLRQILSNLLDNAVKYSPDGGRIQLGVDPDTSHVRFSVADEGLGIPLNEQPRIFEKFHRLDPNQTRGVGGTGLGLYIARELVMRMNGRIWVESEVGEGSTFYVELPIEESVVGAEVLAHIQLDG